VSFCAASRPSGFFYETCEGLRAHTLGCFLRKQMDHFSSIPWRRFEIILCLSLFGICQLGRASASFVVIEASTRLSFPGIKPIREGETIHRDKGHPGCRMDALATQ
jgi:hypothetical protein